MSRLFRRLVPRTIRGQITAIIIVAVVAVSLAGRALEPLRQSDYFSFEDLDTITERANTVAALLSQASPVEREAILRRAGAVNLNLSLIDAASLAPLLKASQADGSIARLVTYLFPPDRELPIGGRRLTIEGRPAISLPVDDETALLVRDLPETMGTSDFIGPLTYYILSFLTLLLLFSVYAVRAVTAPLARISSELNRSDGLSAETWIKEAGTVEVVGLARALNAMRTRIREMVDTRTRMLRSVSHDLRTPLTRLRLRTERLDNLELRQTMMADIDHIDALVAETLDYLRTDASGESRELTDVASLMQTIQANFADVGFAVTYDGPSQLIGQCKPNALTRAVTNLCDNALKFGGQAAISLSRSGPTIRIDVADEGPGIPADRRAMVLEPFFKLDAARGTARKPGFGLGLSIVADIVKAHAGTLEFHDRLPRGLIVRLLLPSQ